MKKDKIMYVVYDYDKNESIFSTVSFKKLYNFLNAYRTGDGDMANMSVNFERKYHELSCSQALMNANNDETFTSIMATIMEDSIRMMYITSATETDRSMDHFKVCKIFRGISRNVLEMEYVIDGDTFVTEDVEWPIYLHANHFRVFCIFKHLTETPIMINSVED